MLNVFRWRNVHWIKRMQEERGGSAAPCSILTSCLTLVSSQLPIRFVLFLGTLATLRVALENVISLLVLWLPLAWSRFQSISPCRLDELGLFYGNANSPAWTLRVGVRTSPL